MCAGVHDCIGKVNFVANPLHNRMDTFVYCCIDDDGSSSYNEI